MVFRPRLSAILEKTVKIWHFPNVPYLLQSPRILMHIIRFVFRKKMQNVAKRYWPICGIRDIFPKQNIRKRLLTTSMNGSRKQILPRKPLPRTLISLMNWPHRSLPICRNRKAIQKYRHKMHFTVVVFGSIPHRILQFSLSWMKNIKMKKTSRLIYSSVSTGPWQCRKQTEPSRTIVKKWWNYISKIMEKIILIFYLTPKKKHNTMWMNIKQPSLVKVKLFLPNESALLLSHNLLWLSLTSTPDMSKLWSEDVVKRLPVLLWTGQPIPTASLVLLSNRWLFTDLLSMIWDLLWQTLMWIRPSLMRIQTARLKMPTAVIAVPWRSVMLSSIPVIPLPYSASVMWPHDLDIRIWKIWGSKKLPITK